MRELLLATMAKERTGANVTPDAELMLFILAANGGEMTKEDASREFIRVLALSAEDRAVWRTRITPLVREHVARAREK